LTATNARLHRARDRRRKPSVHDLELDGTKIGWYRDRVEAWKRGERIAPITMDVAWTRKCAAACNFCYAQLQASEDTVITRQHALRLS
jgi:hypothetical protein